MSKFAIRLLSLVIVAVCIVGYNTVLDERFQAEAKAKAEYEEKLEDLGIQSQTSNYEDGTYTGSAKGYGGMVEMSVTIDNGMITSVDVISAANEDAAYWNAASGLVSNVIAAQSADVDVVSGATFSSKGLLNAVGEALEKASVN